MSIARAPLRAGGRFESLDLQGSPDNAEYAPLGHAEEDQGEDLEEFDIAEAHQHQPKRCSSQFWWAIAYFFGAILVLSVIGVVFHWGVPFFLDKVIIPLMLWESKKFSRPVLAVVLVLSLALFPVIVFPSGPSMWVTGMMFGYGFGFLIIMGGTTIGQTLPYFIGRWLLHDRIQMWLTKYPKKAAVLRVAERGGWLQQVRTITLLRVSPFPYPLFNYAVTATNIKYGPYIVGSILGMVPEAFITIYSGRLLSTLADVKNQKRRLTPVEIAYNLVGACVAVTIAVSGTVYGRRALQDMELKEIAEREAATQHSLPMANVVSESSTLKHSGAWAAHSSPELPQLSIRPLEEFAPPPAEDVDSK